MPMTEWQGVIGYIRRIPLLKKLFWVYFLLLIFEGALRKWIFPDYSAPLLLVRDPIAMLIIFEAYRANKWPERWSVIIGVLAIGFIALCVLQVVVGDNPWVAALYGLRSDLLPFPVAFIMAVNLDAEDLRRFGVCSLWLMLPEAALEVAQYIAPPSSILNVGAYKGAAQIGYVGEHVRASGTFSFVVGPASYGPMVGAFILNGLVQEKFAQKWLLWAAAFALILTIPVCGSRTLLVQSAAVVACAALAAFLGVSQLVKSLRILIPLLLVFSLATFLPVFSESSRNFGERIQGASAVEGKGSFERAIAHRTVVPLWLRLEETDFSSHPIGQGMGRGAAAIAKLQGKIEFTAGESEIDRSVFELGPFPGLAFTIFRFGLALLVLRKAITAAREGRPLALLFAPLVASSVALGVVEQPTEQGFMVMFLAFSLAALNFRRAARTVPVMRSPRPLRYSMPGRRSG